MKSCLLSLCAAVLLPFVLTDRLWEESRSSGSDSDQHVQALVKRSSSPHSGRTRIRINTAPRYFSKRPFDELGRGLVGKRGSLDFSYPELRAKRSVADIENDNFEKRRFDRLGSGLIGKRPFDELGSGIVGKRRFDRLGSGLIGKRRFDRLGSGLVGKRPFDRLGSGIIGKRRFDRLGSGLIGKRRFDRLGSGLIGKRPFDTLGSGLIGKRRFDELGAGLIGKRRFDRLGAGLIGKRRFDTLGSGLVGKRSLLDDAWEGDAENDFSIDSGDVVEDFDSEDLTEDTEMPSVDELEKLLEKSDSNYTGKDTIEDLSEEALKNRSLDSPTNDPLAEKRPFDRLGSGLIGKRRFDTIGAGLVG